MLWTTRVAESEAAGAPGAHAPPNTPDRLPERRPALEDPPPPKQGGLEEQPPRAARSRSFGRSAGRPRGWAWAAVALALAGGAGVAVFEQARRTWCVGDWRPSDGRPARLVVRDNGKFLEGQFILPDPDDPGYLAGVEFGYAVPRPDRLAFRVLGRDHLLVRTGWRTADLYQLRPPRRTVAGVELHPIDLTGAHRRVAALTLDPPAAGGGGRTTLPPPAEGPAAAPPAAPARE